MTNCQNAGKSRNVTLASCAALWCTTFDNASRITVAKQRETGAGALAISLASVTAKPGEMPSNEVTASLICAAKSVPSSSRSCTDRRTIVIASSKVVPNVAKPCAATVSFVASATVLPACACMIARVNRWPTLSWISRAIRVRSPSIAIRTDWARSSSISAMRKRFERVDSRAISCARSSAHRATSDETRARPRTNPSSATSAIASVWR